ncbi:MAG: (Fe-S)-binding protein [Candidatus Adiutricales bacterium]
MKLDQPEIKKLLQDRSIYMCLECGKCSASCPRVLAGREYTPRLLAKKLIHAEEDDTFIRNSVWECLTCGLCDERCPSGVEFTQFICEMRSILTGTDGLEGFHAHDGALHSWMRMMTSPHLKQNRLDWIDPELKVAKTGPLAYFTGCAPYFDVFFSGIEVNTLAITRDSVKLLNLLGIEPVILGEERCCGHDLLWTGDDENFKRLCDLNFQEFKTAGVEEIVFSCPECYQVFSQIMPEIIPGFNLKATLLIDLLNREVSRADISFKPLKRKATFQDPCRLGRMAERYDEPRALLEMIPDLALMEMENSRQSSICCGNNGFVNCDAFSKRVQVERLKEARASQADLLVTSCPKCMIHITCAMRDPIRRGSLTMEIRDLMSLLTGQIDE